MGAKVEPQKNMQKWVEPVPRGTLTLGAKIGEKTCLKRTMITNLPLLTMMGYPM
jgi:hypothetical protein